MFDTTGLKWRHDLLVDHKNLKIKLHSVSPIVGWHNHSMPLVSGSENSGKHGVFPHLCSWSFCSAFPFYIIKSMSGLGSSAKSSSMPLCQSETWSCTKDMKNYDSENYLILSNPWSTTSGHFNTFYKVLQGSTSYHSLWDFLHMFNLNVFGSISALSFWTWFLLFTCWAALWASG